MPEYLSAPGSKPVFGRVEVAGKDSVSLPERHTITPKLREPVDAGEHRGGPPTRCRIPRTARPIFTGRTATYAGRRGNNSTTGCGHILRPWYPDEHFGRGSGTACHRLEDVRGHRGRRGMARGGRLLLSPRERLVCLSHSLRTVCSTPAGKEGHADGPPHLQFVLRPSRPSGWKKNCIPSIVASIAAIRDWLVRQGLRQRGDFRATASRPPGRTAPGPRQRLPGLAARPPGAGEHPRSPRLCAICLPS